MGLCSPDAHGAERGGMVGVRHGHILGLWVNGRAAIAPSCRRKRLQGRLGTSPEVEVEVEGSDARASAVGLSKSVSQSVSYYHTPSRELMAHTLTLLTRVSISGISGPR